MRKITIREHGKSYVLYTEDPEVEHFITAQNADWSAEDEPEKPAYHIPGPYEIALTVGAALCSTGRYETPGAALAAAWTAVPEYFQGRDFYLGHIVPIMYGSPKEDPNYDVDETGQIIHADHD